MNRHFGTVDIMGIDILGIDIMGVDILGIDILALLHAKHYASMPMHYAAIPKGWKNDNI